MKIAKRIIALLIIGLTISACNKQTDEANIVSLWINSQTVDCVGVAPMKCMQVQESDSIKQDDWKSFYSKIDGFEFEKGFVYHLKVKKEKLDPKTLPADVSSIKYILIEQISKEKAPVNMDGKWKLVSVNMKALAITEEEKIPEIKINLKKKQLSGFNGCNRLTMGIELGAKNMIGFQAGIMTRMACPEPNYENDFMEALNSVKKYSISDTNLVFFNEEGVEVLSFQRLI